MEELEHVEFLPEPEDARILSAIDPAAVGFQGAWRAEVTGWAPLQATPIQRRRRQRALLANGFMSQSLFQQCLPFGILDYSS